MVVVGAFLSGGGSYVALAQDLVDPSFAPIIRGPGSVRALAWHPGSERIYVSVSADKLNGQMLSSTFLRFDAEGNWESAYGPALNGTISHLAVMADGRMVIAGSFTSVGGHATNRVARLLSDGSVDTTFSVNGTDVPSNIMAMAVGEDGTTYLGTIGYGQTIWDWQTGTSTVEWPRLVTKISPTGEVAAGIGPRFGIVQPEGSGNYYYIGSSVAVQALHVTGDGNVLVGGNFTEVSGSPRSFLAKLNSAGELQPDYLSDVRYVQANQRSSPYFFRNGPGVASIISAGGDSVYVGGSFNQVDGYEQKAAARLNPDGTSDGAFRIFFYTSYFSSSEPAVQRMARDGAGRVILVGSLDGISSTNSFGWFRMARVDAFGQYDSTFTASFGNSDHVAVLPGNAVVFGRTGSLHSGGSVQPAMGKVSATGVTSTTFRPNLRNRRSPDWLLSRPDQGPIIGSLWMQEVDGIETSGGLAALSLSGAPETAFATNVAANSSVHAALRLPNGRLILGGSFTRLGGAETGRLALVERDGQRVPGFDLGSGPDSDVRLLKLLPSGRVLVGGNFTNLNGERCQNVFMLDLSKVGASSGLRVEEILSARYGTETVFRDVKTLLDAALLHGQLSISANNSAMGGDPAPGSSKTLTVEFRTNRGVVRTARVREGSTLRLPNAAWDSGLVDTSFAPAHTESLWLYDAAEQSDGSILLLGNFNKFAGQSIERLVRLSRNGVLDTTFNPKAQFSSFYPEILRVDGSGRIYVAGSSMTLTGSSNSRQIYRLSSTGAVDTGFSCPSFLSTVEDMVVTPDGSIWCAGSFSGSGQTERRRIVRLTEAGGVDPRFDAGDSANSTVNSLQFDPPQRLWLAGSFTSFQGIARDGVALINLANGIAPFSRIVPRIISVKEGALVRFELADTGSGETYLWRRNGTLLSGATSASLELAGVEPHQAGNYEAEIFNNVGNTRSQGVLTVQEATLTEWLTQRNLAPSGGGLDSDGDGWSNEAEYLARTNPLDANSSFATKMEPRTGGILLRWDSYPGRTYFVEESDDFSTWSAISPAVAGDGLEKSFQAPFEASDRRLFWRVRVSK